MNLLKLARLVSSLSEEYELTEDAEILVQNADGWLDDFTLEYMEETFDGFFTANPAGLKIVPKIENEDDTD